MTDTAPEAAEGQATDVAPEAQEGQATTPETNETPWYETADDETKGYIQNKGWDDPLKAINAYKELEKFRGANENELLKLPKDAEAEGAFDEIYDKLGRPESADKYEIDLPEGIPVDEARLGAAKELAHKLGLNNAQLQALAEQDAQYMAQAMEAMETERAATQEAEYQALVKEWGSNANEREELARRGLKAMLPEGGDKEALSAAIEDAIGTAATLKLFANVGDKIGREAPINDGDNTRPFGYTSEQAAADRKTLMDEIKGDKERLDNYNKGIGPDVDKMQRLNKIIAG